MSCEREFRYLAISEAQNYFSMCHASNLLRLKDGTILTVFFAGTHEGESDTAIYSCRAKEGESSQPKLISQSNEAHWNPVLFLPDENQDKEIVLFFKVGNIIASWRTMITRSHDGGISWDIPKELVIGDKGGRGPVRNKPIRTSSGAILCPASLEDGVWRSFVDISTDELASLHKSNEIFYTQTGSFSPKSKDIEVSLQSFSGQGIIQPTLWEDSLGVHALMRSTFGKIIRADSEDGGNTFNTPYPIDMPNNNSGIDAVYFNNKLYLVCNPVNGNWAKRSPISLFSSDDGIKFKEEAVLASADGEFSYPCIRAFENNLYISYTYFRKNIVIEKFIIK